jgi:hypothetical protein
MLLCPLGGSIRWPRSAGSALACLQGLVHVAGARHQRGVWQFLRGSARLWRSPLTGNAGHGEADIHAAEQRLGVTFPAAVGEASELSGRRADLTGAQDRLVRPGELRLPGSRQVLVFRPGEPRLRPVGRPAAPARPP